MEEKNIETYLFSNIHFADLLKIVTIRIKRNFSKFDEWFSYSYILNEMETIFLENLLEKHSLHLPFYTEEALKMKFLSPILNQVNFMTEHFQDWYDSEIVGMVNGVELKGYADMMVAKSFYEPEKPYFFIQEFKPSKPNKDPEVQLLAEMLVALEYNQAKIMRGSYIIGQIWKFVILEKIGENNFEYFVSEAFDSLKILDLKRIYVNLQAVKFKYCVD